MCKSIWHYIRNRWICDYFYVKCIEQLVYAFITSSFDINNPYVQLVILYRPHFSNLSTSGRLVVNAHTIHINCPWPTVALKQTAYQIKYVIYIIVFKVLHVLAPWYIQKLLVTIFFTIYAFGYVLQCWLYHCIVFVACLTIVIKDGQWISIMCDL